MEVSSEQVKRFLLELIDTSTFPGKMAEFVVLVKKEVQSATVNTNNEKSKIEIVK